MKKVILGGIFLSVLFALPAVFAKGEAEVRLFPPGFGSLSPKEIFCTQIDAKMDTLESLSEYFRNYAYILASISRPSCQFLCDASMEACEARKKAEQAKYEACSPDDHNIPGQDFCSCFCPLN